MKNLVVILLFIPVLIFSQEKSKWEIEFNAGAPVNLNLPLTISQEGFEDIKLTAKFRSEPFNLPIYWVLRVSKWKKNKAWEFEMIHQKLYLENTPSEIEYFSITHGFNMIFINRAFGIKLFNREGFIARVGTGVVFAHAENKVRGKEFDQEQSFFGWGYYLTFPNINLALSKRVKFSDLFYANLEVKNNTSYAEVPVVDGKAKLWHSSFAFVFGLGVRL